MYMTVLKCKRNNIVNREEYLDFFDGSAMHAWLTRQQDSRRRDEKILYRVMESKDAIFLFIQTKHPFNCNEIDRFGLTVDMKFDMDDAFAGIGNGSTISFDTVVWPGVAEPSSNKKRFIEDPDKRKDWLKKKFSQFGADIIDSREYRLEDVNRTPKDSEKEKGMRYVSIRCVNVQGKARIRDVDRFRSLVENGLGKMKNYGAGLVLVR